MSRTISWLHVGDLHMDEADQMISRDRLAMIVSEANTFLGGAIDFVFLPSWRFKALGGDWPFVQIVAPADYRMLTRPADPQHVPRPGTVEIVAKVYGLTDGTVLLSTGVVDNISMSAVPGPSLWRSSVKLAPGLHQISAAAGDDCDTIRILVRPSDQIPRRPMPVAPGRDVHALGAWLEHGIEGTQLDPNKNGMR